MSGDAGALPGSDRSTAVPSAADASATARAPLSVVEARVSATWMEKARTVPDSYPLALNALLSGCKQKTSRDPVLTRDEALIG